MNSNEKALSRIRFQNKVYKSDGQAFEDLFTEIMSNAENGSRKIEAWGNLVDFKNDGYMPVACHEERQITILFLAIIINR